MQKEIIKLISDLIKIKSVKENAKEKRKALDYVAAWLEKNKIKTREFKHRESPSLLATIKGNRKEELLILVHLDVVPAREEQFTPKLKGKKLFGRGVVDNKGCVVLAMLAMREVGGLKDRPTVKMLVTTDEEVGGFDGAGKLFNNKEFEKLTAIFVPDGGEEDMIVYKEKGVLHLSVKTVGKSAHGSRPWDGENAIDKALEIYGDIKTYFKIDKKGSKNNWYTTVNMGKILGGDAINKVPDEAEFSLDIRFTEEYKLNQIINIVKKIIGKRGELIIRSMGDLLCSNEKDKYIQIYKNILEDSLGFQVKLLGWHGASDARFFAKKNIPIWLHRPDGGNLHSQNEWIDIVSTEKMVQVLVDFVKKI